MGLLRGWERDEIQEVLEEDTLGSAEVGFQSLSKDICTAQHALIPCQQEVAQKYSCSITDAMSNTACTRH